VGSFLSNTELVFCAKNSIFEFSFKMKFVEEQFLLFQEYGVKSICNYLSVFVFVRFFIIFKVKVVVLEFLNGVMYF